VAVLSWRKTLSSRAAWSDALSYTIADLKMLRRELVVGYLVAGFLAVVVPSGAWNAIFIRGHGGWTIFENATVGPIIAFVGFVCSIGNVPMAAALWKGGISFGGVISFLFADLLATPLVMIYRRYYGGRLTLRLIVLFWVVMAGAGLIVEGIFSDGGSIPGRRPTEIAPIAFHWNYTSVLNIISLAVFAYLYWLYRNRSRLGGGVGYALDPVCGMQVRTADAPATRAHAGHRYWFCSDHCAERFALSPTRFINAMGKVHDLAEMEETTMAKDHVCGMNVDPASAAAIRTYQGRNYCFCAVGCAEAFDSDRARYVAAADA
jgi:YHS domain-containing protein